MVLCNKTTSAISSVCGSDSSSHIPQIVLLREAPDYTGAHGIKHMHNF